MYTVIPIKFTLYLKHTCIRTELSNFFLLLIKPRSSSLLTITVFASSSFTKIVNFRTKLVRTRAYVQPRSAITRRADIKLDLQFMQSIFIINFKLWNRKTCSLNDTVKFKMIFKKMSEILSRGHQNVVRFCRRFFLAYVKPNLLLNVLKHFFMWHRT